MANKQSTAFLMILTIAAIGAIAWATLVIPDRRSTGERIGDAVDALPRGVDKAAEQLGDRSPAQKVGDAVEKAVKE